MSIGWVIIHRCLIDKPIWRNSTSEQKVVLITLLLMMDFKPNEQEWKGEKFQTKPGQKVTSLNSIMEKSGKGISIQNVRSALKRFEKLEFLTNEPTNQGRLITITNWGSYQDVIKGDNIEPNKEVTKTQQRGNKELTPNEQSNKVTKKQGNINKRFSKPSLEDVQQYCLERKNNVNPQKFIDYYESKGWKVGTTKMKDWKAAVRTWENNQFQKSGGKHNDFSSQEYTGTDLTTLSWTEGL